MGHPKFSSGELGGKRLDFVEVGSGVEDEDVVVSGVGDPEVLFAAVSGEWGVGDSDGRGDVEDGLSVTEGDDFVGLSVDDEDWHAYIANASCVVELVPR
jgi:hypothetical protein